MVTDWANGACYPSMKSLPDFMNVANGAVKGTLSGIDCAEERVERMA